MSDFQAIIDFSIQLNKFINIDLFQRGFYQIRLFVKLPNCKLANKIEINSIESTLNKISLSPSPSQNSYNISESSNSFAYENNSGSIIFPPCVINGAAVSKTFRIIYKNEEIILNDTVYYRVNICLDALECLKQMQKTNILIQVELWFTDQECLSNQHSLIECVSTRQLQVHFDLSRGVHYNLPVIFDYFHLSAITMTIHGCLVTICQPYIYKNDSSMWLSNWVKNDGKDDKKIMSTSIISDSEKRPSLISIQIRRLQLAQWKLISVIVTSLLSLRKKINEYYRVLPPWQQAKINFDTLFGEISLGNLSKLSQECFKELDKNENFNNISSLVVNFQNSFLKFYSSKEEFNNVKVEDLLTNIEHDIAYLSGVTIDQWHRFLRLVTHSDRINQHLAKIHHLQRIKRFAEGFFCVENMRSNLNAICDQNSISFLEISETIRKSSYFTQLPPCDVECVQLDGDSSTLPIIFEEKYEPITQTEESNTKTNSTPANGTYPQNSSSNSLGYFSSPSKYSNSSSSTTSSNSSKSNIKLLFSKFNNIVHEKPTKKENVSSNQIEKVNKFQHSQINTLDFLGLYSNELFKEDDNNNFDQMNMKIKLINSFLNKKNIIKSCSRLSLDYSDKRIKHLAKSNQSNIVHMLRNTISLEQPVCNMLDINYGINSKDQIENSRSWPNLVPELDQANETKAIPDKESLMNKANGKQITNSNSLPLQHKKSHKTKSKKNKNNDSIEDVNFNLSNLFSMSNTCPKFQGTMYFPKPPKEFAMEEVDEPTEEVNLKPIPASINKSQTTKKGKEIELNELKLEEKNLSVGGNYSENGKIKNFVSCQDLITASDQVDKPAHKSKIKNSKDDIYLKSGNLNETQFTFIELLQSDHCLICCGSIKKRLNESWPCTCKKSKYKVQQTKMSPPTVRRVSAVGSDFISFLHAKEEFRSQICDKVKNLLFYSDFHTLASRIPYFQCDSDFRAFNSHKDLHLIVCVHGLDGNSADLRLVKTYLELGLPTNNFEFLMSQRNQGETFDSLETLTTRLVNEIDNHVSTYNLNPSKISFIGHSLGNIIIRAAISRYDFMKRWRDKLHTFLSLSGPHLGLAYNRSGLVNMGLWFIQKFKKAASLTQLSMKDASDIRQTYLYQLSLKPGLEYFRNILFCGSSQDYYVPIHSAHVKLCNAAVNDTSDNGIAYREMTNNILQRLTNRSNLNIVRYDVHHVLSSNANSLIGRAAHIAVLDSELFIEKFMVVVGLNYFV